MLYMYTFRESPGRSALGRAVEHASGVDVFKSGALSSFNSFPGTRSATHKTLAVKKRNEINQSTA